MSLSEQYILKQVTTHPNNNALFVRDKMYSYKELWELVMAIYNTLPADKPAERIGIYCNNDVFTYASVIAVNLYGAAYVPLNPKFPVERNKNYVEQCRLHLVLSSCINDDVNYIAHQKPVINTSYVQPAKNTLHHGGYRKTEQPTCYILFTSGTTGQPKGVPVSHASVESFFNYFLKNYDFVSQDKFLQVYELSFDVSVFSFFMPLLVGACCYTLPEGGVKYLHILDALHKHNITVVSMVPTVLKFAQTYFNELVYPTLRYSFFSGDALMHYLAAKWQKLLPNGKIHNFYGPTETTIVCSRYIFDEQQSAKESVNNIVPIGKLFEGMTYFILDEDNQPAQKGELCIAGPQVISHYLNNQDEDKFLVVNGTRFYKTGDICSLNEYENLVFYGRADTQVKINGYRIELSEIENVLYHTTALNTVVLCIAMPNGMNKLVAYLETASLDTNVLKQQLQNRLPEYMIPQDFILLDTFVLNSNGKIDKQLLKKLHPHE